MQMIITGDSHMRGYASGLPQNLNNLYKIAGHMKPTAIVSMLTPLNVEK
jgi:hypothetical protein